MEIKLKLFEKCKAYVEERLKTVQQAIDSAKEAGGEETKSSAGDKHETGRAMMQLEQEKNSKQLSEALVLKAQLERINPSLTSTKVVEGSLVITDKGNFFISIGAGKIEIDNNIYYAISRLSPIASKLIGLEKNNTLIFNGINYLIKEVL